MHEKLFMCDYVSHFQPDSIGCHCHVVIFDLRHNYMYSSMGLMRRGIFPFNFEAPLATLAAAAGTGGPCTGPGTPAAAERPRIVPGIVASDTAVTGRLSPVRGPRWRCACWTTPK